MENSRAKPTENQRIWAEQEFGVIIHYLMDTYNPGFCRGGARFLTSEVREYLPASAFAPQGWDTDQWIRCAAEAGASYAVLVANHCTGFSLWPTKANDYSVASCSYQNGNGDIVRDFIESCRKYGLKPGLYYSCCNNGYYDIRHSDGPESEYRSEKYQSYARIVEAQVTELWSQYGDLFEIWFDGGTVPVEKGGPDLTSILKKYQPNAICFQGPDDYPHNIRWVGNEDGWAPEDCFSSTDLDAEHPLERLNEDEQNNRGNPAGKYWKPAETDMPNRSHEAFAGGWAWDANETGYAFSPEYLFECYVRSVGRNTNFLLGMAIGADGRFEDEEQFIRLGALLKESFGDQARIATVSGSADRIQTISLDVTKELHYLVLREDIREGHRITGFRVLADGKEITNGRCIGHKRILPLNGMRASEIAVELTETETGAALRDISVF